MRTIDLPAFRRHITIAAYLRAIRIVKANPEMTFNTGLTTWWPTTVADVMDQFRKGMTHRINQALPYIDPGKKR